MGSHTNTPRSVVRTDVAHLSSHTLVANGVENAATARECQSLVQQILDAVSQPMAVCDSHGILLLCNRAWAQLDDQADSVWASLSVGANIIEVFTSISTPHWPSAAELKGGWQEVLIKQKPFAFEFAHPNAAGTRRFKLVATPINNAGDAKMAIVCEETKNRDDADSHAIARDSVTATLAELSDRERQILDLVLEGEPNKSIAVALDLSQKTVEKHRSSLMRKLDAQNVVQLVRKVYGLGKVRRM